MTTRTHLLKGSIATMGVDWGAIYADQLPRVYNFFRYRFGDGQVAEDLTAATFEKAWRARERYKSDIAAFSTWVFVIARHVSIDYVRRERREISLEDIADATTGDSPEETIERDSDLQRLEILLGRLPARERELVALKYGAGLTNRDIAKLTGLSETNVGTILHRLVRALRAEWEEKP
jgi:RNA polymerase sigma-70 factor (ECF subfamily)